jgi:1-aminocyclopropane-1-carboxylate deaminase/D-cysteine desulfhydrase-like pyridoxal-dependent ACC family enzyme
VVGGWAGPGYGVPTEAMAAAVRTAARSEGLLLDPVYTGKALAGLGGLIAAGAFGAEETVAFLHTGGMPALFAYRDAFEG